MRPFIRCPEFPVSDLPETVLDEALLAEADATLVSIRDFIRFGVSCLRLHDIHLGHGSDDAFAEATALVMQTLGLEWSADAEILDAKLLPSERRAVIDLLRRRVNERIPLGYLLNLAYFAGHPFYVDERVLIPRSPIAELIQARFRPWLRPEPQRLLDLCTGSGCIAVALAHAFPEALVDATDISLDALGVAAVNVEHHELGDRVNLIESDVFDKLPGQRYDLIVSNPPYVDAEDMADLPPEFRYEPELGLAAGRDGLDIARRILAGAADHLTENGLLVVEVGNSEWALEQEFPDVPFQWVEFENGGQGVFMLTAAECREHQETFKAAARAE
jgi:ribosomal protein L3 glutamine methyltransferase